MKCMTQSMLLWAHDTSIAGNQPFALPSMLGLAFHMLALWRGMHGRFSIQTDSSTFGDGSIWQHC